jgi:hypothetical protein
MQKYYSMKPNDVAIVEAITSWWRQEMEDRTLSCIDFSFAADKPGIYNVSVGAI